MHCHIAYRPSSYFLSDRASGAAHDHYGRVGDVKELQISIIITTRCNIRKEWSNPQKCLLSVVAFLSYIVIHLDMRPTLSLREVQQSATALVRSLLSEHSRLSTQELFRLGVGDARPVLPADHAIQADGRLRMKKVSNMREGRRLWVPPPTAPYPGHPFRSVQ